MESREQLKYPPVGRIALLTLKGRNEEKVRFSADYLKHELEKAVGDIKELVLAGPAPAPLLRAETYYRYQIMLRAQRMVALSQRLALLIRALTLPEDVLYRSRVINDGHHAHRVHINVGVSAIA